MRPVSRPAVTLKLATSLDGRIATAAGESQWITGEPARAEVHRLRAGHDAVLVGSGTALADDPELSARTEPAPARQPVRVVLDSRLRTSTASRLARTLALGPVLVIGARDADRGLAAALEAQGVRVALVPRGLDGLDLPAALAAMQAAFGVGTILIEGGGQVAGSFMAAGLVDRIEWFRAPIVLGADARPAIGPLALERLADARRYVRVAVRETGPDLWESYERKA